MNPRALAAVASLALLAGCGGGGGSSVAPQPSQNLPANTPAIVTQSATVNIFVPRGTTPSSSARAPQFVSPNAASLAVTVLTVNGVAPTAAQVPPSVNPTVATLTLGQNCAPLNSGMACSMKIPAPTGAVKYLFQLKDSAANLLAVTTVTFNVTGGNQVFGTSLNGVVRTVTVTAPSLSSGQTLSNAPVTVAAFDASGSQIVGSTPYANPFTLTDGDGTGHTALVLNGTTTGSTIVVNAPTDTVGLNYDGSNQTQTFAVTASGGTQAGTPAVSGGGAVNVTSFSATSTSSLTFGKSFAQDSSTTTSVALPSAGGFSGTEFFTDPFSPVTTSLSQTLTNSTPSGVAQSLARSPQGARLAQTIPPGASVLFYFQEEFDHTIQFPAAPSFTFHIPSGIVPSGSVFYVGYYDASTGQWNDTFEGPITVSGTTVTFTSNGKPFTFLANVTYTFRLIYFPPGVPTPAPSATPAPIVLSGTTLDDAAHGGKSTDPNFNQPTLFFVIANQTEVFSPSQTGNTSFFLGLDTTSCGSGASAVVTASNQAVDGSFSVTSTAVPGFCRGFVTGAEGSGATVWFSNTSATVGSHEPAVMTAHSGA